MNTIVSLYSQTNQEIANFLKSFNNINVDNNLLEWKKEFENPIEIADIIGVFIDNNEKYKINMWISLDKGFFLNVTEHNADQIIRYLFERSHYYFFLLILPSLLLLLLLFPALFQLLLTFPQLFLTLFFLLFVFLHT